MSNESIKPPSKPDIKLNPLLNYVGTKMRVEFKGSCLKQDGISLNHGKIVNIYIVYEINENYNIKSFQTLENCLFGAVKLTKYPNIDNYKYSGYGIGFDRQEFFSLGNEIGRNVIIFGVDMSSSPHIYNKKKDISILGKGSTQGLEHTLAVKNCIQSTLLKIIGNCVSACIIMEQIVVYLLMLQKLLNLKQKILKL